ncbi:MAG: ArsR/SmtB family transcription factor [Candidatus Aminicenantaceae bacterium]
MKQALKLFKSLSDPTRLRILLLLIQKNLCVCEITFILAIEQSRISHQLRILRDADLVEDLRDGKWIVYRITEKKKKDLKLIFGRLIGMNLVHSKEIKKDQDNLQISLKNNIRAYPFGVDRKEI